MYGIAITGGIMRKCSRVLSMFLTVALLMSVFAMPAVARQGNSEAEQRERRGSSAQVTVAEPLSKEDSASLRGAAVEIVEGSPVIVLDRRGEEVHLPISLPASIDVIIDGVPATVEVVGNYLLVPVENGIEKVCISEFIVREATDGQIVLEASVNPVIHLAASVVTLALAGVTLAGVIIDGFTTNAEQTISVNRWTSLGSSFLVSGFNFGVTRPLRNAAMIVRAHDVDPGEVVLVTITGQNTTLGLAARLPNTGNNVTRNIIVRISPNDLDTMAAILQATQGMPIVRIAQTQGCGFVRIDAVRIKLDW